MPANLLTNTFPFILIILSAMIVLLIWNTGLRKELKRFKSLTLMDHLTATPNRKGFDLILQKGIRESNRTQKPLSILLLNVDDFTEVNLRYNCKTGDALLEQLSSLLKRGPLKHHVPCRWGSDEFIILMKDTTHIKSGWFAEALRKEIEDKTFEVDGQTVRVTASIATTTKTEHDDLTSLLHRTQLALKEAKAKGGNTCCNDYEHQKSGTA